MKEIEKLARNMSEELFVSENGKGKKANMWICGDILLSDGKETKCAECNAICYYDTKVNIKVNKNVKKICLKCVYENHLKTMTFLEQEIIKKVAKIKGWE